MKIRKMLSLPKVKISKEKILKAVLNCMAQTDSQPSNVYISPVMDEGQLRKIVLFDKEKLECAEYTFSDEGKIREESFDNAKVVPEPGGKTFKVYLVRYYGPQYTMIDDRRIYGAFKLNDFIKTPIC